jgi:predicted AlkP superfamily phosphohydrolase/phosphomutase
LATSSPRRTFVVGLDGCSWNVLLPLLESGQLPHLQALRGEGAHGTLESTIPFYTGPAWASFATGSSPAAHGIWDFLMPRPDDTLTPAHESDLRRATYYELLADAGRPSVLVNLPLDQEGRDGVVVVNSWLTTSDARRIFPRDRRDRYSAELDSYRSYPTSFRAPLDRHLEDLCKLEESRFALARRLVLTEDWEHFFLLFSSTDWLGHAATGRFLAGDPEARSAFLRLYGQLDAYVGWVRENASDALLVVMSDHGQCEETHILHVNGVLNELGLVRRVRERPAEVVAALGDDDVRGTLRLPAALSKLPSNRPARAAARLTKKTLRKAMGIELVTPKRGLDADRVLSRAYTPTIASYAVYTRDCTETEVRDIREALLDTTLDDGRPALDGVWTHSELFGIEPHPPAPTFVFAPTVGVRPSVHVRSPVTERATVRGRGAHQRDGILLVAGAGVQGGELGRVSLYDICPTLLWFMDAAIPADLDGRILFEAFDQQAVESRAVCEIELPEPARRPHEVDSGEVEQRLRDLGYV